MLLDLAKSKLVEKDITKRRTLSDIPEIPPIPEQSNPGENVDGEGIKPAPEGQSTKCDAKKTETTKQDQKDTSRNTDQVVKSMQTLSLAEVR